MQRCSSLFFPRLLSCPTCKVHLCIHSSPPTSTLC
jgi:hypothetical protein